MHTPHRDRTYNLLIKRTLHTLTVGRKCASAKAIAESAMSVDATEYPINATRRHDIRHDTLSPLLGGEAGRTA